DLLLVTKSDGDLLAAATRAASDYQLALHLMRPRHHGLHPKVLKVSSVIDTGIIEAWDEMVAYHGALAAGGALVRLREAQARLWFWSEVQTLISEAILEDAALSEDAARLEAAVASGGSLPSAAARSLLKRFRGA
ncbi:MAG TPA: hypothetical protein VJ476_15815, partial [Rhizomicrobium sp.]|nr:hypothetical protein [Rhizomicrobium sp.]